jgi:predicted transglutaminase-like protease
MRNTYQRIKLETIVARSALPQMSRSLRSIKIPLDSERNAMVDPNYGPLHLGYVTGLKGTIVDEKGVASEVAVVVKGKDMLFVNDQKRHIFHYKSGSFFQFSAFSAYILVHMLIICFLYFNVVMIHAYIVR